MKYPFEFDTVDFFTQMGGPAGVRRWFLSNGFEVDRKIVEAWARRQSIPAPALVTILCLMRVGVPHVRKSL